MDAETPTKSLLPKLAWTVGGILALAIFFIGLNGITSAPATGAKIESDIRGLQLALVSFKQEFGSFPQGDTRSICKALMGSNQKQISFVEWWPTNRRSPEGEFLDPWSTPYRIYFSGDFVFVRSAGANRRFDRPYPKHPVDDYFSE